MKELTFAALALLTACEPLASQKNKDAGPCHDEVQSFGSVYNFACHKDALITRDGEWWKCVCPRGGGK